MRNDAPSKVALPRWVFDNIIIIDHAVLARTLSPGHPIGIVS